MRLDPAVFRPGLGSGRLLLLLLLPALNVPCVRLDLVALGIAAGVHGYLHLVRLTEGHKGGRVIQPRDLNVS